MAAAESDSISFSVTDGISYEFREGGEVSGQKSPKKELSENLTDWAGKSMKASKVELNSPERQTREAVGERAWAAIEDDDKMSYQGSPRGEKRSKKPSRVPSPLRAGG
ncbi:hypothetical protein MKZ38_003216 [Zalerion maritima]|uniref:Uncharacterized protein n=1 Tax=Zalerion maritima TaxID=339359 RepID=A0AAD5S123_9PEZI|nr:hypothetical protein MKZ38_003216 [Zalerion maritima]